MIILGIDTSCDDTSVAILKVKSQKSKVKSFDILSNIVSSQVKLHAKYGGVYPFLAKREHQRNLAPVLKKALEEARLLKSKIPIRPSLQALGKNQKSKIKIKNKIPKIDLVAVTVGPGLEPCLWVGVNFAKELAQKLKLPLIPVNHIEAHILANFVGEKSQIPNPKSQTNPKFKIQNLKLFPAVCLVVSGGHTQLILMEDFLKYKILGETRDDTAGECLDKAARILGLGYPGGPAIAAEAATLKPKTYNLTPKLPRPMIYQKNYDFSFSGLKTAVLYDFKNRPVKVRKSKEYIRAMSAEVQQAIIDVLISKTLKAAQNFKAKSIILGGGVAANEELRRQFRVQSSKFKVNFFVPPKKFCTDNAAMVAVTGYFHYLKRAHKYNLEKIKANANLRIG
jgi:N6-L-threonylcarbamoyladenine synthase